MLLIPRYCNKSDYQPVEKEGEKAKLQPDLEKGDGGEEESKALMKPGNENGIKAEKTLVAPEVKKKNEEEASRKLEAVLEPSKEEQEELERTLNSLEGRGEGKEQQLKRNLNGLGGQAGGTRDTVDNRQKVGRGEGGVEECCFQVSTQLSTYLEVETRVRDTEEEHTENRLLPRIIPFLSLVSISSLRNYAEKLRHIIENEKQAESNNINAKNEPKNFSINEKETKKIDGAMVGGEGQNSGWGVQEVVEEVRRTGETEMSEQKAGWAVQEVVEEVKRTGETEISEEEEVRKLDAMIAAREKEQERARQEKQAGGVDGENNSMPATPGKKILSRTSSFEVRWTSDVSS